MNNVNLLSIFMTGLLTGGLTCMAVQGGLLATSIAQQTEQDIAPRNGQALAIVAFLLSKIIAYTILGALLGWLGSFFQLSIQLQIILQVTIVVFMMATAANLLNLHPVFRYVVIQPPAFLRRFIRRQSKDASFFTPVFLGALTVLIPCGTTQAMMALAVASGNSITGALILAAFTIGTSPVFFSLAYFTTRLGSIWEKQFNTIVAGIIFLLALYNLNGALVLAQSPFNLSSIIHSVNCATSICDDTQSTGNTVQLLESATITIGSNGYSPQVVNVKKNSHITLKIVNKDGYSCAQSLVIPRFNIQKVVSPGNEAIVEFDTPNNPEKISFSCSMGMYQGVINVM